MSLEQPQLKDSLLTIDDRVALLTFNRHDCRNALTGTGLIDDIIDTIDWVNRNEEISVLVLTGAGSSFSAGGNIKEMQLRDSDHRNGAFGGSVYEVQGKYRRGIQQIPMALHQCEVPVIAAVNGPAIGAGFDLCCMCDIRLGSENTIFGETFINLGIIPGDGGAWFLQRLVGYQTAAELTFTGRLVKAEEALELGLLLRLTAADDLLPATMELAYQIAAKPPQALRHTKRLMKAAQRQQLPDFLDLCATVQGVCHNTDDHQEAVDAFLEKRQGQYKGR